MKNNQIKIQLFSDALVRLTNDTKYRAILDEKNQDFGKNQKFGG